MEDMASCWMSQIDFLIHVVHGFQRVSFPKITLQRSIGNVPDTNSDFSEHPTAVKRGSVRTINIYTAVPNKA